MLSVGTHLVIEGRYITKYNASQKVYKCYSTINKYYTNALLLHRGRVLSVGMHLVIGGRYITKYISSQKVCRYYTTIIQILNKCATTSQWQSAMCRQAFVDSMGLLQYNWVIEYYTNTIQILSEY